MAWESNQNVLLIQIDASSFAELEYPSSRYRDSTVLVHYFFTAQSAKQLLPIAEEYEMYKLRRMCENVLHTAYEQLRKEHKLGYMPGTPHRRTEHKMVCKRSFYKPFWPASCEKGHSDICKKCRPRPAAASPTPRQVRVCTFLTIITSMALIFLAMETL